MVNNEAIEQCIKHIKDKIHMSYDKDIIIDFERIEFHILNDINML